MEGTPKAIEIKGIVRNATKIGVQDGQAEDLINLRFMDGSWRASGDGRLVHTMSGTQYTQLYVHTNVYHHLLGVCQENGQSVLKWFAEIGTDGTSFYPLDGTTSRTNWPEDMQGLPTEPVALTTVVGDIWITQTGHLLTVIDENDDFEFFVFKTGEDKYITVDVDVNGKTTDRLLYPFGKVHFNLYEPAFDQNYRFTRTASYLTKMTVEQAHNEMNLAFAAALDANKFTKPFLVVAACRLYDGSHAYASQPVLVFPRQLTSLGKEYRLDKHTLRNGVYEVDESSIVYNSGSTIPFACLYEGYVIPYLLPSTEPYPLSGGDYYRQYLPVMLDFSVNDNIFPIPNKERPVFSSGTHARTTWYNSYGNAEHDDFPDWGTMVMGSDLVFTLKNVDKIDGTVIKGIDIFITLQADIYVNDYTKSPLYAKHGNDYQSLKGPHKFTKTTYCPDGKKDTYENYTYIPKVKSEEEIIDSLMKSPFYLLKSYSKEELLAFNNSTIVDLTNVSDRYILKNLTKQNVLETESFSRTTYLPKVSYMYNGRLHIANYKTYPFFGYPLDLFHLHNHSVKVQEDAWFPNDTTQKVLPNLTDNNDAYLQGTMPKKAMVNFPDLVDANAPFFIEKVYIDSEQGKQVVCRYIPAYDPSTPEEGRADFIESLNPLLTYPDVRAKKMEIYYVSAYSPEGHPSGGGIRYTAGALIRYKEFKLKPHPYLNIAYYIDPNLKPIILSQFDLLNTYQIVDDLPLYNGISIQELKALVKMQNAEEYFPNGLKVSKTDQPMFFPVENTYQVGSAEILALMSNTIAVGTGQTGDAPLYVFCKDGVYALYVDASGQMAYPNARILARDVCNNPRSVTPIDAGVVFTTDRGLMMIAGEQVQEIGAPAEGDVVQFWNAGSVDYSKIATASMQQIAGLPSELCSTTDFLTYLQDKGTSGKAAIINYNHNMRELMVSNPNYPYSYVLDREGNWSRRDYTASQYVNNYPTSYRVDANGHFYKVDDEGDANTTLEHRKEADNKIFYLSNVIKLDSIGFKQAYRFVVRGYFETMVREVERVERAILQKSIDSRNFYIEEDSHVLSQTNLPVMNHLVGMSDVTNGLRVGDVLVLNPIGNPLAEEQEIVITEVTRDDVYLAQDVVITEGVTGFSLSRKRTVIDHVPTNVACVVEGSYDGRKFKPLGYNRKSGKFRDIGCIVERTDVRFYRVCLSGQVTGKTRIDYMEMSAGASMLNTKIR